MAHIHVDDAEKRLTEFLTKFTPEIAWRAAAIIAAMRERLPGAIMPVYDNYNGLAVGFGPKDRVSDVIFRSPSLRAGSACSFFAASRSTTR